MDIWEDVCSECGGSIQRALVGRGNVRYRYNWRRCEEEEEEKKKKRSREDVIDG